MLGKPLGMLGKPLRTENDWRGTLTTEQRQTPGPEDHLLYILIKEIKDFKHTHTHTQDNDY